MFVKAVLETTNLDNANEVLTAAYMAKNVVRNQRAMDEFNLDWANVAKCAFVGLSEIRVSWAVPVVY